MGVKHNQEEIDSLGDIVAQLFDGSAVFFLCLANNSHHHPGIQTGSVSDDLPEVIVIGVFRLVLDNHGDACGLILGDEVTAIGADMEFLIHINQRQALNFIQLFEFCGRAGQFEKLFCS